MADVKLVEIVNRKKGGMFNGGNANPSGYAAM